jgi:glycosyltransferase involved in cell wall biosynthesis
VSWVQDCYGIAAEKILTRRFGWPGRWIGRYIRDQDNRVMLSSDAVIFISDDFYRVFPGMLPEKATVIENWAPLSLLPVRPRMNPWSIGKGLTEQRVLLYSGTLGLKHQPELLVQLAVADRQGLVVVVSEGLGRAYLEARKRELELSNLRLFDFQPLEALPDVTGSADVLVAMVEKDAGAYSVPSKVLTYLCAGRPLLAGVPESNLAARIVRRSGAGIVVDPDDVAGFVRGALALASDPERAQEYGSRGRAYAAATFDIGVIAERFESVLQQSVHHPPRGVAMAASAGD